MLRLILILSIVGGLAGWFVYRWLRALPPPQRRAAGLKIGLGLLALLVLALTVTGRMHWVGAAITALLVGAARLLPVLLRLFPMILQWWQHRRSPSGNTGSHMSRSEALAILGLDDGADRTAIVTAHRRLMQKLHPDRGGNDHLAAKLNKAKDVLLG